MEAFARWAGIRLPQARTTFDELAPSLVPVRTPIGKAWVLALDEESLRAGGEPPDPTTVRLLPSGDALWLLYDDERALLVPDPDLRARLWTSRVWPGALLLGGDIAGTWRRAGTRLSIEPWRDLTPAEREAVEAEAAALPLPDEGAITVRWPDRWS
ncbi:hypothetical protein BH23ACT9_BH23ACT9_10280 [soil metagenome]